jgi:DNA-binding IclR family transcriptional regulator
MTVLCAFRPGDEELTLAELHRRIGLANPTVHRLLVELIGWDVVERIPTGVRLSMRLFELGQLVPRQRGLLDAAAPFLADLFAAMLSRTGIAVAAISITGG